MNYNILRNNVSLQFSSVEVLNAKKSFSKHKFIIRKFHTAQRYQNKYLKLDWKVIVQRKIGLSIVVVFYR